MTEETSGRDAASSLDGLDDIDMRLPDADPTADAEPVGPDAESFDPDGFEPDSLDSESLTGDLDPETLDAMEEAQRAMDEARARLAEVPAEVVVTNHVMGLYELAAIHLSATPPDLNQAALAIDAVACLVEGLGDRLGDDIGTMRDALNNIRLAFVQIKGG